MTTQYLHLMKHTTHKKEGYYASVVMGPFPDNAVAEEVSGIMQAVIAKSVAAYTDIKTENLYTDKLS